MSQFALDSSSVLTWVLQEPRWQAVDAMLRAEDAEPVLPGPALTEVIHIARRKGNASSGPKIAAVLTGQGFAVEHPVDADLVRAAELLEVSAANPGEQRRSGQPPPTLSLGDALILAVVERLGCPVVTRDGYWSWFAEQGLTPVKVVAF
ncbi:MAG: PIN domain-containing protein [Actinomycetes bacterium]